MSTAYPQESPLLPNGQFTSSWRLFLQTLRSQVRTTGSFAPTPRASSGTITAGTSSCNYMSGGGSVLVTGAVGITNNGTGAGAIVIDLPSNLWAFTPYVGSCAQFVSGALVGKSMLASLSQKSVGPAGTRYTGVVLTNPDGTYPTLTANDVLRFSIQYFDGTA